MSLEVGQLAPDFTLRNQHGQPVTLSDYRGEKNVVVMFFPKAFTPTCTREFGALVDQKQHFETDDTIVLGVSTDTDATLRAYADAEGITYQLLSDHWPHGAVAQAYGTFLESRGFALRGTFIVDKEGVLRWQVVNSPAHARDPADYREALAAL